MISAIAQTGLRAVHHGYYFQLSQRANAEKWQEPNMAELKTFPQYTARTLFIWYPRPTYDKIYT